MNRCSLNKTVRWAAPLLWMGVIFALSAQSQLPDLVPSMPGLQAPAGHFCAYAILAWLWWQALRGAGVRHPAGLALLIAVTYGISDEYHQSFVPGRTPDIVDLAVDAAGASLALLSAAYWPALRVRLASARHA